MARLEGKDTSIDNTGLGDPITFPHSGEANVTEIARKLSVIRSRLELGKPRWDIEDSELTEELHDELPYGTVCECQFK